MQKGKQSLCFTEAPFIISTANIVGKKEGEGPLAGHFDVIGEDDKFGQNTWEEAESTLQKEAFTMAVGRAGLKKEDIRYLFAGDLLGQTMATSFGVLDFQVPLFGLYGACSTCGESLSLGAMCVAAGYADHVVTMTSSHFASAEKQFRFPLGNSYLVQVLDIKYKAGNFKGFIQINFFYYSMPKFLFSFLIQLFVKFFPVFRDLLLKFLNPYNFVV